MVSIQRYLEVTISRFLKIKGKALLEVIGGHSAKHSAHPSAAATMVEVGRDKKNPDEFAMALDETLGDFAFPDEFVFDVWGAIGDAKQGRF